MPGRDNVIIEQGEVVVRRVCHVFLLVWPNWRNSVAIWLAALFC